MTASAPSIKATLFQLTANRLAELVELGRLTQADLDERLLPEDKQYLGRKLAASSWVPVTTMVRVTELAMSLDHGDSRESLLREEGARGAHLIHKLGLYKQFEASGRAEVAKAILTFAQVAYNFTRWTFEPGLSESPDRIVVTDARHSPELSCLISVGFLGYMFSAAMKCDVELTWERPTPDTVVFTLRRKDAGQ